MSLLRRRRRWGPKHPGFERVANHIAKKQGISVARARAELAAGTRRSSAAAKRRNPRLRRVKGKR